MSSPLVINAFTTEYPCVTRAIVTNITISDIDLKATFKTKGIWDTGATNCAITAELVQELNLKPISMVEVSGVHGKQWANVYLIHVLLENRVRIKVRASECSNLLGDKAIGMLIGMDVISIGDFAISNCMGRTLMSFRIPSTERIDFVADLKRKRNEDGEIQPITVQNLPYRSESKVSRNDPCPCGSGKKYKNCHGRISI